MTNEFCRFAASDNSLDSDAAVEVPTPAQAQQYAEQYTKLKQEMLGRTQRFGGLLGAYLFLTVSGEVSASTSSLSSSHSMIDHIVPFIAGSPLALSACCVQFTKHAL